jgi:hypothetical protein
MVVVCQECRPPGELQSRCRFKRLSHALLMTRLLSSCLDLPAELKCCLFVACKHENLCSAISYRLRAQIISRAYVFAVCNHFAFLLPSADSRLHCGMSAVCGTGVQFLKPSVMMVTFDLHPSKPQIANKVELRSFSLITRFIPNCTDP